MTTTIEREIVQMVFDAKEFRKGIQNSINDLADFKKSFNFSSAQNNFAELEKSSEIDFSTMAQGIESINSKLGVMGVTAAAIVANITESVLAAGKKMADALIIDPITGGLEEYEIQLNAVQTILANTAKAGTTLDDVTNALNNLNEYADLTIYNFSQMVDSIGKFTTAGVDLETSVGAIKGIANVAALSGANAQQASNAMYQLSQAISSGVVRLQDWISVENAGLGGQIFRDSLMETARVHGIAVDRMVEKAGGFRFSLKDGWLESEIMLETLQKLTGDLSDAQLEQMGYTEEQIVQIQELAQTAVDSATKIKTLTALKDTLGEALGSGWAQTWMIVLGNFEEAKQLWGDLATFFTDIIDASTKSRNRLLQNWKNVGGRDFAIEALFNILNAGKNVLTAFGEALGDVFKPINTADLLHITLVIKHFSERLLNASEGLDNFKSVVRGVAAILDIARLVITAVAKPILALLIPSVNLSSKGFFAWLGALGDTIVAFREFAIETGFFDIVVSNIIKGVKAFIAEAKRLVAAFLELDVVGKVVGWFWDLVDLFNRIDWERTWKEIQNGIKYTLAPFYLLGLGIQKLYKEIERLQIIEKIVEWFQEIDWQRYADFFNNLAVSVKELFNNFKQSELLEKFITLLKTFDGRRLKQFVADAKTAFAELGGVIGAIRGIFEHGEAPAGWIVEKLKDIGTGIIEGIKTVLDYLIHNADNIDYSQLFDIINKALFGGLLLSIKNLIQGGILGGILGDDLQEGFGDVLEGLGDTLGTFQTNIKADTLRKIAGAIALFAGAMILLTLVDTQKLEFATVAMAAMVAALFGSAGALRLVNSKDAVKASLAIIGLSIALSIASLALAGISGIDPEEMSNSLEAMGLGLIGLVTAVQALDKGGGGKTGLLKTVGLLIGLSFALLLLSTAIFTYGKMDPKVLEQGLTGVSVGLAALGSAVTLITRFGGDKMISAALGITIMSAALLILQRVVAAFGAMEMPQLAQGLGSIAAVLLAVVLFSKKVDKENMVKTGLGMVLMAKGFTTMAEAVSKFAALSWEELGRGLVGLGAVLAGVVVALHFMEGTLPGAAAMLVASVAMIAFAAAITIIGQLEWEQIGKGLAAIGAFLVILAVGALILTPVMPTLLLLGGALLGIGLGAALFGLGVTLAASGLVLLAGSAVLIGEGIKIVGNAIIEVLPRLGEAIAEALVNFLSTIAENMPTIIQAFKDIVLGMIGAFVELIPDIVGAVLDFITALLETIAEKLPDLIQAGFDILLAILQGIEDNIQEVVTTALAIITEFIDGIAEGLPDVIDSAFNLLLTFLQGVEDAVDEYTDDIVATGISIAGKIISGVVQGIWDGLGSVAEAVKGLAGRALDALRGKDGFEEQSPSKKTYEVAKNVVMGFVNGIRDNIRIAEETFAEFVEKAQNGISPLAKTINDELDRGLEFAPIIRPVLDLDNLEKGTAKISKAFDNSRILAELSYEGQLVNGERANGVNGNRQGVTFVQHNYSPKALDREAIYRQTRTQIAKLSEKVFE